MKTVPLSSLKSGNRVVVRHIVQNKPWGGGLAKLGVVRNTIADIVIKSKCFGVVLQIGGAKVAISSVIAENIFVSAVHI